MTLNQLSNDNKLKLPGSSSWGGSFGGSQPMYSGDGSELVLAEVWGGNSESDEFNIVLTGRYEQGEVKARITDITSTELKDMLLLFLGSHIGEELRAIYLMSIPE